MKNTFPGRCFGCNRYVPAEEGERVRQMGRWRLFCAKCDPVDSLPKERKPIERKTA